ncbi:MAG: hypothetical protein Q8P56_06415 [Candidatus Uhrbacteria bacterium]|nr:hypothetical protein [Candidatus Uhrbacteria bacterium]
MKNYLETDFGPFGLPQPSDEKNEIDQLAGLGDLSRFERTVVTDPSLYFDTLKRVAKILRASEALTWQSTIRLDVCGMDTSGGDERYIDSILTARKAYRVPSRKRSKTWIHKPEFLIHAYAVGNMLDDRGRIPLPSESARCGYFITAGSRSHTEAIYVRSLDRKIVEHIHDLLVRAVSEGSDPVESHAALRDFYKRYKRFEYEEMIDDAELIWKGVIPTVAPIPFDRTLSLVVDDDVRDEHEVDEYIPGGWDEYELEKRERMKYAVGTTQERGHLKIDNPDDDYCPRGCLPPRRAGEKNIYIDEIISAYPGGVFIRTQAIGIKRDMLASPQQIDKYKMTVGVEPFKRSILIYTTDHDAAVQAHSYFYQHLRGQAEKHSGRRWIEQVVPALVYEYCRMPDVPTLKVLKS